MRILILVNKLVDWTGKIASGLILLMIAIMLWEVFMRYVFMNPTIWATELTSFIFGAYILLGGAYALVHRAHVGMDILYNRFSQKGQIILDLITTPFFLAFSCLLVLKGSSLFWSSFIDLETSGTVFNPPLYPVKLMVPIGGLFLFLVGIGRIVRNIIFLIVGQNHESC
jgi:TRAP-type mannitol/chloroaromatic compound transport system permease small subunit